MIHPMMWFSKILVFVLGTCLMSVMVNSSQTVMTSMTKKYVNAYEVCVKEYNLSDDTRSQLANFWNEGFEVTGREAGCALHCLSTKLDLIDPEGKFHHGNTVEFAKQHGSDETTAQKILDIVHTCEKDASAIEDKCLVALNIAMCFKKEIHKLNWAPDPEKMFDDIIDEINTNG